MSSMSLLKLPAQRSKLSRPQVGMNPAWFYFPAFTRVFRSPWEAGTLSTECWRECPARFLQLSQRRDRAPPRSPARLRLSRRGLLGAGDGSLARRPPAAHGSLRPESSGGPASSLQLFQSRRPSDAAKARRARRGCLGAGDRAPARRPGTLAATLSVPTTKCRCLARSPRRLPGALSAAF